MAAVDALLAALHDRTREIRAQEPSSPDSSLLGWDRLARNAMRVLAIVDPPPELMSMLRDIVDRDERRDPDEGAWITAVGLTLGALADTIVAHPEVAAAASRVDRLQLRSSVLGTLHAAAAAALSGSWTDATSSGSRRLYSRHRRCHRSCLVRPVAITPRAAGSSRPRTGLRRLRGGGCPLG